jgi:hypothetical protein
LDRAVTARDIGTRSADHTDWPPATATTAPDVIEGACTEKKINPSGSVVDDTHLTFHLVTPQ